MGGLGGKKPGARSREPVGGCRWLGRACATNRTKTQGRLLSPMNELTIDLLRLNLQNGAGHEHRLGPIAERAAALFAEKAAISLKLQSSRSAVFETLASHPVDLNLNGTSNEQAASAIADAWLQALTLRLNV
jgi:hypothetical protein